MRRSPRRACSRLSVLEGNEARIGSKGMGAFLEIGVDGEMLSRGLASPSVADIPSKHVEKIEMIPYFNHRASRPKKGILGFCFAALIEKFLLLF